MDGQRFDEMTRRLSALATRRRALGVVAGLLGGAAVAGEAAAGPASVRRQVCRPAGVGCTRDTQCCSGECETSRSLPRNRRNRCACIPQCDGKECGDNGCGGECGSCASGEYCDEGDCEVEIDCSTYLGSYAPGASQCFTTIEGRGVLSLPCPGGSSTACASSADCADEATQLGEIAVCATGGTMCFIPGKCAPSTYPEAVCKVAQTAVCPG